MCLIPLTVVHAGSLSDNSTVYVDFDGSRLSYRVEPKLMPGEGLPTLASGSNGGKGMPSWLKRRSSGLTGSDLYDQGEDEEDMVED